MIFPILHHSRRITLALHRSNSGVGHRRLPEAGIVSPMPDPSVTR